MCATLDVQNMLLMSHSLMFSSAGSYAGDNIGLCWHSSRAELQMSLDHLAELSGIPILSPVQIELISVFQ